MKPGRINPQASSYFCLIAEDTVYPNIDVLEFPDQFVVAHKFDKPNLYYDTPLRMTAQPEKILHHRLGNIKGRALGCQDILKGREFRSEYGHRRRMIIKTPILAWFNSRRDIKYTCIKRSVAQKFSDMRSRDGCCQNDDARAPNDGARKIFFPIPRRLRSLSWPCFVSTVISTPVLSASRFNA